MIAQTYTVLIVEDFPADRELYRRFLLKDSSCDYVLLEADSVKAGLELCRTRAIDAILLDYLLPDGDGLEFLVALAAGSDRLPPPVIMLTGQGDERIAVQAMRLGVRDYLLKSGLTPELLQLAVRAATIHHQSATTTDRWQGLAGSEDTPAQRLDRRLWTSVESMFDCFGIYSAIRDAAGQISDFRFDYLNAAALASNRMTTADLGKGLCELFPNVRKTGLFAEYVRTVETGAPIIKEDLTETDVFGGQSLTRAYSLAIGKLDDGLTACWRDITAQKQAQLTVHAANERIINIWESMTDAYVNLDRDLRLVYTNQAATTAFSQLTGLTSVEFMGKTHGEVFPALAGTFVEQEYHRAIADRVAVHLDVCYEPTRTWFEIHAYPSDEGLGIYFRDITERQRLAAERLKAEQQRIAAEQERDLFFNLSIDMLAIGSFDGYLTRLNPAFEQTLGFTTAKLMAQPFIDFVHPDDREHTIAGAHSLTQGDRLVNFENRYRCKDGSYRWISWSATPNVQSNTWYAIGRDITEQQALLSKRIQQEALIREREQKFSAVFNQTFELVGLLDLDGVVIEVNQTALNSIVASESEIVGANFWETPWWTHSEQLQHQLQAAIVQVASGQLVQFEMQFPAPSGTLVSIDFSLKPIVDESGRTLMMLAEGHDITVRNQTQAALEQRNQDLDSFVYIVSHDLKAPLRAVANLSEWIEDDLTGSLTDANQQQMNLLRSRIYRMESTIDGLLEYARIGRTDDRHELVDVAQLLAETIDTLLPPPTFTIAIAQNLPTLYTKRLLLTQVFANLIGNGIKHHDLVDGSLHIGIAERGNFYEFTIADDGPGIAPEHQERMFKIFQAMNPQKRSDSTGIGLAIVKKIVEAEGGTICLESQPGRGTTFYFTWPKG
jgi:PAS domain S-box-containing protein